MYLTAWNLPSCCRTASEILDVGTGGGVPGLIFAICRPDLKVSVCESVQKKAKVVEAIVSELHLPVTVYGCRAEEVLQLQTFDTLVARGVAALAKIPPLGRTPLVASVDRLLLIKGRKWVEERGEARHWVFSKIWSLRKGGYLSYPSNRCRKRHFKHYQPKVLFTAGIANLTAFKLHLNSMELSFPDTFRIGTNQYLQSTNPKRSKNRGRRKSRITRSTSSQATRTTASSGRRSQRFVFLRKLLPSDGHP